MAFKEAARNAKGNPAFKNFKKGGKPNFDKGGGKPDFKAFAKGGGKPSFGEEEEGGNPFAKGGKPDFKGGKPGGFKGAAKNAKAKGKGFNPFAGGK